MGKKSARARSEKIHDVVAPVVQSAGFDLEAVDVRPAGRRSLVVITVDADEVDSDGLAEVSRRISEALDATDVLGEQPYTLEVSSRGVGTPLTLPRHWRRNIGRLVAVHLADGVNVSGRITGATEKSAVVDDTKIRYSDVERAVVQVEFGEGG